MASSQIPEAPSLTSTRDIESACPEALYTAQQVRELDRVAIVEQGIPGIVLMKRAGRAVLETVLALAPTPSLITVYCGSGNNAGDGYIVAALAAQQCVPVRVIYVASPSKLSGDAAKAYQFALQAGVECLDSHTAAPPTSGIIVDALLGTGLQGEVRDNYRAAIQIINQSGLAIVAVDLPSGLCADTGQVMGDCVNATATITLIGMKRGLCTGRGPALVGRLSYASLEVPAAVFNQVHSQCRRLSLAGTLSALTPRAADAHKGDFGHVLVLGGDHGMGGAALLAAEAAARSGAGLVSVATRPEHVTAFLARRPEIMAKGVEASAELTRLLERATVLVVGPGLGQSEWSQLLLKAALASGLPMVVDADALNLLAGFGSSGVRRNWVLTPHPGEAARLLGSTIPAVTKDRFAAIASLVDKYDGTVVLKGAGSLIASAENPVVSLSPYGNPGMATGGMGDVLSGVIGGLLAQNLSPFAAAQLGVVVHGLAADRAIQGGQRGLLASDLLPHIRRLLNSENS